MSSLKDKISKSVDNFMRERANAEDIRSLLLNRNGSQDKLSGRQISTPNGIAISPQHASRCLNDASRSRVFLLGLRAAVAEVLKTKSSVHILEAGGGPHPLSLLLAAHVGGPITVTSVDINPVSVQYSTKLAEDLGVDFQGVEAELTGKFDCETPDIILAEVMDAGLLREPQAAATWALSRKFGPDLIFLPDEIVLRAFLNRSPFGRDVVPLGELARIDGDFRRRSLQEECRPMTLAEKVFQVPKGWEDAHLSIETDVGVYGEHRIAPGLSVITNTLDMRNLTPSRVLHGTSAVKVSTRMGGFGFQMQPAS